MKIVTGITSQPKQTIFFVLSDGSQVSVYLEYRPQQLGWFANFSWQTWTLNGLRLVASPNILRQWGEIIPFGFSIQTQEFVEPVNQTDFSQEIAILYLLDADDVASTNETIYEGN